MINMHDKLIEILKISSFIKSKILSNDFGYWKFCHSSHNQLIRIKKQKIPVFCVCSMCSSQCWLLQHGMAWSGPPLLLFLFYFVVQCRLQVLIWDHEGPEKADLRPKRSNWRSEMADWWFARAIWGQRWLTWNLRA